MKRILSILSAAVLVSLSSMTAVAQTPPSAQRNASSLLVDAVQDYDSGNYQNAVTRLTVVKELDPANDAACYYLGLCYHFLGQDDEAEKQLEEAVRLDSVNYWYRDRLAAVYSVNGKMDEAVATYESLLEDYPKKTEIHYSLVNLYAQQNDFEKVLGTLDSIEKTVGKDESTVLARYDVLIHMDKAEEAYAVLEEFNDDYSSPQILSMMGDARLTAYKDTLALECYNEALSLEPDYAPAVLGKAEVYRLRRDYGGYFGILQGFASSTAVPGPMKSRYLDQLTRTMDARFAQTYQPQLDSLFDTCLDVHPADSSVLVTAGTYYFRSERRDRAKEIFKRNCTLFPESFDATGLYIQSLNFSEDWEGLAVASEEAFSRFPDDPVFLEMVLAAHYNMGDSRAVIADAGRIMSVFPADTATVLSSLSTIGDTYFQLGDMKSAFKHYNKALKLNPDYAPVLNNYAYYLSILGKRLNKAYSMSKKTVEQEPDNATYLDTFAWILHLQGKDLEAKSFFKHAMLYGGKESSTILEHFAEVLKALGEEELAKVYFDQASKKKATE